MDKEEFDKLEKENGPMTAVNSDGEIVNSNGEIINSNGENVASFEENPLKDIRAILPRTFSREDLTKATKRMKTDAAQKGEVITWSVAKERAIAWFKAMCGAPAYDKTVIFAPPVKTKAVKKMRKKHKSDTWWKVTTKTNKERKKIMKARMEILAKMGENKDPDGTSTNQEET